MTRLRNERILEVARNFAKKLLLTLEHGEYHHALDYATHLAERGVDSLESLSPRGTLKYAAGSRLHGSRDIERLVDLLASEDVPNRLLPACCDVLASWGGGNAVPVIIRFLLAILGSDEVEQRDLLLQHAFSALHMIGGPDAALLLANIRDSDLPSSTRDQASWYLNQLGERVVDPMFGAEGVEPTTAEEVVMRDSLWDPFRWGEAYDSLVRPLREPCLVAWRQLEDDARAFVPARFELEKQVEGRRWPPCPWAEIPDDQAAAYEGFLTAAFIRLSESHLVALEGGQEFFPDEDIETGHRCEAPDGWWAVLLVEHSESARYLDRLPLFRVPAGVETWEKIRDGKIDSPEVQGVFRSWANRLPAIGQDCNRRGVPLLTFVLAVLHDHLHRLMRWERPPLSKTLRGWFLAFSTKPAPETSPIKGRHKKR